MNDPMRLSQRTLTELPHEIARPAYDRNRMTAGIVHIGVGGFHRAHQAFYTDALMRQGLGQGPDESDGSAWGICGVGLRDADQTMAEVLGAQDGLYTLIVRHPGGTIENRVIGSLTGFMMGRDDPEAVIDRMADPATRIVSLTITEGGYNVAPDGGGFDWANADAQHDLDHPLRPRSVFGYLTAALKRRRDAGIPAFTVMSCDNIQHNGDLTRRMVLAFAARQDPELAAWIERAVCFPNAMVDRITPVTTAADRAYLANELGLVDAWPVTCEPFCQWVIEDRFSNGRPAWEKVGAQFVADVTPYERMKLRLLNAGHSVLALLGSIHGHATIDGCVSDPLFAAFLRRFMDREATPVLDAVEGIDVEAYQDTLIERFGNPNIKDALARICLESSSKLPVFLIPTIRENLARGGSIRGAALVIAAWCLYCDRRVDRHGKPLEIVDAMAAKLHNAAAGTREDPLSFLKLRSVFADLAEDASFAGVYAEAVGGLYANPDVSVLMRGILEGRE